MHSGNTGEGRRMTDRSNLVEIASLNSNFPIPFEKSGLFNGDAALVSKFAFLDQVGCDNTTDENANTNCRGNNISDFHFPLPSNPFIQC